MSNHLRANPAFRHIFIGLVVAGLGGSAAAQAPIPGTRGDDLALLGSTKSGSTLPVAFSNDDGSFSVSNGYVGDFASWAADLKTKRLAGDFNRDGWTDYALVGGPGFPFIPVAMSRGNGQFTVYNVPLANFGAWSAGPHVTPLVGDFDRDGDADIALVGGAGWNTIPIAWSNGNGSFTVTNNVVNSFAGWAADPNARPLVGDFNRDGMADIALIGGASWTTLPVAFSYGNGSFDVTNNSVNILRFTGTSYYGFNFAAAARSPGAKVVTGDFNHDGMTDIAVAGGANAYASIETAFSYGNGAFDLRTQPDANFGAWANTANVTMLAGDFNRDGFTDLALTGGAGWYTIPVATSRSGGAFTVTNNAVAGFGAWASTPGARPFAGDFNGDGYTDIALTGVPGWGSIPVAMSRSNGMFDIYNRTTLQFPTWAAEAGTTVLVGRTH